MKASHPKNSKAHLHIGVTRFSSVGKKPTSLMIESANYHHSQLINHRPRLKCEMKSVLTMAKRLGPAHIGLHYANMTLASLLAIVICCLIA